MISITIIVIIINSPIQAYVIDVSEISNVVLPEIDVEVSNINLKEINVTVIEGTMGPHGSQVIIDLLNNGCPDQDRSRMNKQLEKA